MQIYAASLATLVLLVAAATASIDVYEEALSTAPYQCKPDDSKCSKNYLQKGFKGKLDTGAKRFPCKLVDSECMKKFLQNDIIGKFSNGFPEFGVTTIDPLHYEKLSFTYEVGVGTKFTVTHVNPILYGLAKTTVNDVRTAVNGSKYSVEANVSISKIFYEGSYTCEGEWILWPFSWKGNFNITLGDVMDTWQISANLVKKGETYLDLQDLSFSPKVSNYKVYATGLFGDLEEVGKFALEMTNVYWQNFFDVMWRNVEPHVVGVASDEIRGIFAKIPVMGMVSA